MNLNTIAEQDLSFTMEDSDNGFGVDLILKSRHDSYPVTCQTTDISFFIDLQEGTAASGRTVEVNGRISTIESLAADLPCKSWTVDYVDTNGKTWTCRVANVDPDRKLGIYKMILEAFNSVV